MAFFGFFLVGELLLASPGSFNPRLHLAWGDMAVDNPQTDQYGRGVVGRTDCDLCPVGAVLAYVAARGDCQGPFSLSSSVSPLTKPTFVAELRKIPMALGLPDVKYAGHSFWIGAATSAALARVEDSTIQLLGRWQSVAFLRYIRTPPREASCRFSNHRSPQRTLVASQV